MCIRDRDYVTYSNEHTYVLSKNFTALRPATEAIKVPVSYTHLMEFSQKARAKYCDWTIVDKVIRHGKDPIRKLGPQDRLIAPCRMAFKQGIYPKTLIDTIAKALYFDEPSDAEAVKLKICLLYTSPFECSVLMQR